MASATCKGDGPLGDELLKRPSDLTRLSRRNGGEFPYWRVFAVIDGRGTVPAHGERDMQGRWPVGRRVVEAAERSDAPLQTEWRRVSVLARLCRDRRPRHGAGAWRARH